MKLDSSPKIFKEYKCDKPENTIKKIENGFKKLNLHLAYKENVINQNNKFIYTGETILDELDFSTGGKGISSLLSKASAFAEMSERFSSCMFFFQDIPLPEDSYRYRKLLDSLYERQFLKKFKKSKDNEMSREKLSSNYLDKILSKGNYELFKKNGFLSINIDSFSLIDNEWKSIPIKFIESFSGSNGLAAGNTIEEAIAQATSEIFERFSVTKILLNKLICPTIDTGSIKNNDVLNYLEMFKSFNIKVIIKDFTMGNKIPVMGVVFINNNIKNDRDSIKKNRYYKKIECASHVNLEEAILRCFTEYIQTLGIRNEKELINHQDSEIINKSWNEIIGKNYSGNIESFRYLTRRYDYRDDLIFLEKGKEIIFDKLQSFSYSDSFDDCKKLISICKKCKWDMMVVDYTHNVLDFPVVRVIIPPISVDFDPFVRVFSKNVEISERINYYYGIKNFYRYLINDDWINDEKQIKDLITNIEKFLEKEPYSYNINLIRENFFRQKVNLFHILGLLYLSIGKIDISKKYFKALTFINDSIGKNNDNFLNQIRRNFSSDFYRSFNSLLDDMIYEKISSDFIFSKNPFDPELTALDIDKYYSLLIKRIVKSFFN